MTNLVLRALFFLVLGLSAAPALADAYVFPGNMPAGCSGSAGSYTCGSLALDNSDTLAFAVPTTLTVNGNLDVGRASVNAGGPASNLTVVVTGTLSVGNGGEVNGSVRAASITNSGGRAGIGGSLTASGTITLGNSATVARCVQSTGAATITLGNGASVGGVCCGALGACTNSCVATSGNTAMPALCSGSPPPSAEPPGRFNAFDTGTAAGSVSGVIRTKVAGLGFALSVVALDTAGTGLSASFTGSVRVELLDASNNSSALNAATACRSSWVVAAGSTPVTLTFAASDGGRKNVALAEADAWRNTRVRISYPATGTASVVGCSTNNFAIRPARFTPAVASDAGMSTAGTTRPLANANPGPASGNVHKAGRPFTLYATAVNAAGGITTGYDGTPTAFVTAECGAACAGTLGSLSLSATAVAGVVNSTTSRYSEAGTFTLRLADESFAEVDATDGSTLAERRFDSSGYAVVGRFVPDHFEISVLDAPVLKTFDSSTCPSRSFTYLGQPFGYANVPRAMVFARSADGATTVNYPVDRLLGLAREQEYTVTRDLPEPDVTRAAPPLLLAGTTLPSITLPAAPNGTAVLATQSSDWLQLQRSTLEEPFNASIRLRWRVTDNSEVSPLYPGNEAITTTTPLTLPEGSDPRAGMPFNAGPGSNQFRFGTLKLNSAYGSELIHLAVPMELLYWNGTSFVTNTQDSCTTVPTSSIALGNYRSNLAACETAPGSASLAFLNGRSVMRMLRPGAGNAGSVDATVYLGALPAAPPAPQHCSAVGPPPAAAVSAGIPWLQGKGPASPTYDQNPSARISFGQHRSPLIHLREVF